MSDAMVERRAVRPEAFEATPSAGCAICEPGCDCCSSPAPSPVGRWTGPWDSSQCPGSAPSVGPGSVVDLEGLMSDLVRLGENGFR